MCACANLFLFFFFCPKNIIQCMQHKLDLSQILFSSYLFPPWSHRCSNVLFPNVTMSLPWSQFKVALRGFVICAVELVYMQSLLSAARIQSCWIYRCRGVLHCCITPTFQGFILEMIRTYVWNSALPVVTTTACYAPILSRMYFFASKFETMLENIELSFHL